MSKKVEKKKPKTNKLISMTNDICTYLLSRLEREVFVFRGIERCHVAK